MRLAILPLRGAKLAWCLCAVLGATLLVHAILDRSCSQLACRGDFPAFYTAAKLAFDSDLYQASAQQALQQHYWPSLDGAFLYFAYPPYTALLYYPLSILPAVPAKLLLLFLSVAALLGSARLLAPADADRFAWIVLALLCIPSNFIALAAGQNLFFSLLLAMLVLRSPNPALRGIAAALLWFKPQYGAAATLVLLFAAEHRALRYHLGALAVLYALAVLQQGWAWPYIWLSALRTFSAQEMAVNAARGISLSHWMSDVVGTPMMVFVSGSLCVHLIWRSIFRWTPHTAQLWFLAALLLSPRTMFYDFGLCVLALSSLNVSIVRSLMALLAVGLLASCAPAAMEFFFLMLSVFTLYVSLMLIDIRRG